MKNVIRGPYLGDLLQQPAAVEATLAALGATGSADAVLRDLAERLQTQSFERVVLTGMGSSLAALHPLAMRLVEQNHATAIVIDTSELIHSMQKLLDAGTGANERETLVIAVSQSGKSAEIVRLVERPGRAFSLIGVTNTAESPLAAGADAVVLTHAGVESTVSCKTYVATLVALAFLGDVLAPSHSFMDDLRGALVPVMSSYLDAWEKHVAELSPLVDGARDFFFAGRGTSLAAACTAGLIVKESTRVHAEGMTSAALRHGPMEMAADHVFALIYEGDNPTVAPLNRALVDDLRRAGARAHLAGVDAEHDVFRLGVGGRPAALRPLMEILPAQMLSLAVAAQAGIEAGVFRHATKVTATE